MRIVFFGSGAFGLPTLGALSREHELCAIVTQPDKPAGRGGTLTPTPLGAWAAEWIAADASRSAIPLIKPEKVNEASVVEHVRGLGADAWVVIAFGQKLGARLLDGVRAVNLHASLLPRWRGAAPIHHAVMAGDAETGNSVITLADRMDAGLVLGQSRRAIERTQTTGELHDLLAADGAPLVLDVLARHRAGTLKGEAQDESLVTLAGKLGREDATIDLAGDAEACRARINGLSPWPGVAARIGAGDAGGWREVKLLRADSEASSGKASGGPKPGSVISAAEGRIACGRGVLRLIEVQPAGKRAMRWEEFARGAALGADARLEVARA
ncbi:MAG: methionyl-tRNA formyltransferase [Phycisphaerales bacterium]|jgi:methionyl-tRNA formyltransferase|nr:methionyl-tRNA formyltransferase [Phycisphaerales bacterium]